MLRISSDELLHAVRRCHGLPLAPFCLALTTHNTEEARMADRDRHDWDRGRDYGDRDREYGRGGDRERNEHDRGMVSRGADEVRSWFGDDEARRRREMDEQRERQGGGRDYGANSERARSEHGWY